MYVLFNININSSVVVFSSVYSFVFVLVCSILSFCFLSHLFSEPLPAWSLFFVFIVFRLRFDLVFSMYSATTHETFISQGGNNRRGI